MKRNRNLPVLLAGLSILTIGSCSAEGVQTEETAAPAVIQEEIPLLKPVEGSLLDASEMFTRRDLQQVPEIDGAAVLNLESGSAAMIDREGTYILRGEFRDSTIIVDADNDNATVQLVLDGLSITNSDSPAVYVKSADKVFITTLEGTNSLAVTGEFVPDGETNTDAVIFSRSDLIINGIGTLSVDSDEGNGISSKDDLKITGGTLEVRSKYDGLEANDSVRISGGLIDIEAGADAIHAENNDDPTVGYIYLYGGELEITAGDDALRGNTFIQIDGGRISIADSYEGLEATQIRISGGELDVYSSDDGINVTAKTSGDVLLEIYGGDISVEVGSGDTDAFDANGDMAIYGGNIDVVTPRSAFDVDGNLVFDGGSVTINGETVSEIPITRGGGRRR